MVEDIITDYICDTEYGDVPPDVIKHAKNSIIDYIATSISGNDKYCAKKIVDMVQFWEGRPESSLIVYKTKLPAPNAAFANSVMAHACNWDEFYDLGVIRPVITVVPSSFAVAEAAGKVSGKDLLCAIAMGMEIACRIARSIKVSPRNNGWIYSSAIGIFGAAAASGKLLRLNKGKTHHCLGIAYAQASGNHQASLDGALTKRIQPGIAAKGGVLSGYMAARGLTGARHYLSGRNGLFNLYFKDEVESDKVTEDLGTKYLIRDLSYNQYPCGRLTHTSLDSVFDITSRHRINYKNIRAVRVHVTKETFEATCHPLKDKCSPKNVIEAQFSMPYLVALSLAKGKDAIQNFDKFSLNDPVLRDLSSKVNPVLDWDLERTYPRGITPAIVEIELKNGTIYSARTNHPVGHPDNPVGTGAYCEKLTKVINNAKCRTVPDADEKMLSLVGALEEHENMNTFVNDLLSMFIE
jgi:2-methylcitrate dehydratase PrpD